MVGSNGSVRTRLQTLDCAFNQVEAQQVVRRLFESGWIVLQAAVHSPASK